FATGTLAPLASWVSRSISWLHAPAVTVRTGELNTSAVAVVAESTSVCWAELSPAAPAVTTYEPAAAPLKYTVAADWLVAMVWEIAGLVQLLSLQKEIPVGW